LLAGLVPQRRQGRYVFATVPIGVAVPAAAVAVFVEDEGRTLVSDQAGPEQSASSSLELASVMRVLDSIDPALREALVLTAFVGLSQVEAAAALGISLKTIEGRVLRARAKLASALGR